MGAVLKNELLRRIVPDLFITHLPRMLEKNLKAQVENLFSLSLLLEVAILT